MFARTGDLQYLFLYLCLLFVLPLHPPLPFFGLLGRRLRLLFLRALLLHHGSAAVRQQFLIDPEHIHTLNQGKRERERERAVPQFGLESPRRELGRLLGSTLRLSLVHNNAKRNDSEVQIARERDNEE